MEWYLLKSALILSILFGFYKLFLENESMHVFKRFYLLASLPVSFLIPLITFKTYVEMPVSTQTVFITQSVPVESVVAQVNILPFVLWGIYGIGVVYFAIKFGRNLKNLLSKIKDNPKFKQDNITHVLLKKPVIPHTFFNYVFLNKQKFEAREIPDEVIAHEYVHANQKHSIDILTIELLQIAFWFNPLLYFVKRSIKLNHEFLADRAVLNLGTDRAVYQNLLLAFSSSAVTPVLANSINYSFIKKRFTVMKKQTSTRAIWLRSLLVLPLLAFLLYGFSEKKDIFLVQNDTLEINKTIQAVKIYIDQNSEIFFNGKAITLDAINVEVSKLNTHLTIEEKQKYIRAEITIESERDRDLAKEVSKILLSSNIMQFTVSSLEGQRAFNLNTPINEMVGKTTEEAEVLFQKRLKKGEEINKTEKKQK